MEVYDAIPTIVTTFVAILAKICAPQGHDTGDSNHYQSITGLDGYRKLLPTVMPITHRYGIAES